MNLRKKVFCLVVILMFLPRFVAAEEQSGGGDDFVIPVIVDKKVPKTYIEKMLIRLDEFEKNLRLQEKYLIVEDSLSDVHKKYDDFQKWAHMEIHGRLQNHTALQVYQPGRATKLETQLYLSAAGEVTPALKYFVSGRYKYDPVFDMSSHYSDSVKSDEKSELELRDTYVDYSWGDVDLRLGKQQVVWGEAVGLFYADVVNAKDLREYILPDFEFIRIPEWGVSGEYSKNNFHSQLILLPGVEFDKTGLATSNFVFPLPLPNNVTPFTIPDPQEPKFGLDNSKAGGRLSYLFNGLDLGAFFLHSWTSLPVMYRTINAGVYDFHPDYKRQNIFGGTFTKEINDYVCKGEAVYYPEAYFSVIDPSDTDGVKRSGYLDYLLGVDHVFFDRWDVNVQLTQRWIMDFDKTFWQQEKFSNGFSVRLSHDWISKKLTTEILAIVNFNGPDYLYRPKISYSVTNSLKVGLGADIFAGDRLGQFGYFRNQSRWYTEVAYKF